MFKNRFILLASICFAFSISCLLAEPADEEFSTVKDILRAENAQNIRERSIENAVSSLEDGKNIEETRHAQTTNDDRSIEELFDEIIDQIEDSESAT